MFEKARMAGIIIEIQDGRREIVES